jgi:gamma-glutamylcysteine synthetase
MRIGSIDLTKLRGIGDKAFGLGQELVGSLTNNEALEQAGESRQARATEELKALRKQIEAEAKDAKAETMEARQRAAQRAKETADN